MNKKFKRNIDILEKNNIRVISTEPVWEDKPDSVELETYTDAGGDMIIHLEEPSRACLQKYCEDFDINEEVMLWWQNGADTAHEKGLPFSNMKEHYEDMEAYIKKLKRVCKKLS